MSYNELSNSTVPIFRVRIIKHGRVYSFLLATVVRYTKSAVESFRFRTESHDSTVQ